jgi:hypothetical protein
MPPPWSSTSAPATVKLRRQAFRRHRGGNLAASAEASHRDLENRRARAGRRRGGSAADRRPAPAARAARHLDQLTWAEQRATEAGSAEPPWPMCSSWVLLPVGHLASRLRRRITVIKTKSREDGGEIVGNLAGPEVVVLPEVQDLAHDLGGRRPRGAAWRPGPVGQSGVTVLVIPLSPFVKRLP